MVSKIVSVSENLGAAVLYSRGFYFASEPSTELASLGHFRTERLPGFVLQHDELLEFDADVAGDDFLIVVGKAFPLSTGPVLVSSSSIAHELHSLYSREGLDGIERALYDLAGRYAVILRTGGATFAYTDAAATRTVYFDASRHRLSSHLDILEREAGVSMPDNRLPSGVAPQARWTTTRHQEVRALLANQRLDLDKGAQVRFFPLTKNPALEWDHEYRMHMLESLWNEQLNWLESLDRALAMSITGGMDSRFMLAMAHSHEGSFRAMTYTTEQAIRGQKPKTRWAEVMHSDQQIVKKLAAFLPEDHSFILRTASDTWGSDNKAILDRNTTGNHGRWILSGYLTLFPERSSIHYRGNLLEIGRYYFGNPAVNLSGPQRLERLTLGAVKKYGAEIVDNALGIMREGMEELGYADVDRGYDFSDLYYWENRHSRWYGEVLNETDAAFDTITPFNVRRIIDIFLAYDVRDRKEALLQKEMIYRRNPPLIFFGFNEPGDLYRKHVSPGKPRTS